MDPSIQHTGRPRAILFDWDNTLIQSWGIIHDAMNLTLAAMGHPLWTREDIELKVRASLRDTFPGLFGDRWREAEKVFYDSFEAIHLQHLQPLPGAVELLEQLHEAEIYLAVVSNKRGHFLRREAEHLGWDRYFSVLAGAGDAARDKPAIDHVHLALGNGGVEPGQDVWFVGDADIDMTCAVNAKCRAVLLRAEPPREGEFANCAPSLHFPNCDALRAYLR